MLTVIRPRDDGCHVVVPPQHRPGRRQPPLGTVLPRPHVGGVTPSTAGTMVATDPGRLKRRRHSISTTSTPLLLHALGLGGRGGDGSGHHGDKGHPLPGFLGRRRFSASTSCPAQGPPRSTRKGGQAHVTPRTCDACDGEQGPGGSSPVRVLSTVALNSTAPDCDKGPREGSCPTSPRSSRRSVGAVDQLPILRAKYTARAVKVIVGSRWRLQSYETRSVLLETGAATGRPQVTIYTKTVDEADRTLLKLPLDAIGEIQHNGQVLKLTCRSDRAFRLRIRFLTPADAAIWRRVVQQTVTHAQWITQATETLCLARSHSTQVAVVRHSTSGEERVVKTLMGLKLDDVACDEVLTLKKLFPIARSYGPLAFLRDYRVVETPGDVRILMPRHPGTTLLGFLADLARPKVASEAEAKAIVEQICDSLSVLHSHGFVHCDVKLENIMIDGVNNVRLLDFGAAYDSSRPDSALRTKMVGTPGYIAPELVVGVDDPPTGAADIFSLGIVLYQILVGQHPFSRATGRRLTIDDSLSLDWSHMAARLELRGVSDAAQDLIRQLIDSDPRSRIDLEQIRHHSWMKSHS